MKFVKFRNCLTARHIFINPDWIYAVTVSPKSINEAGLDTGSCVMLHLAVPDKGYVERLAYTHDTLSNDYDSSLDQGLPVEETLEETLALLNGL